MKHIRAVAAFERTEMLYRILFGAAVLLAASTAMGQKRANLDAKRSDPILLRQDEALQRGFLKAIDDGHYKDALMLFGSEQSLLKNAGLKPVTLYRPEVVECYFQLKQYSKVIAEWKEYGFENGVEAGAIGISLIRRGRGAEATHLYSPSKMILFYHQGTDLSRFLPNSEGARNLEACFRFERGVERFYHADFKHAVSDFEAANAVESDSPLISYYLGSTLRRLDRVDEAARFTKSASELGGGFVQVAQDFGKFNRISTKAHPQY